MPRSHRARHAVLAAAAVTAAALVLPATAASGDAGERQSDTAAPVRMSATPEMQALRKADLLGRWANPDCARAEGPAPVRRSFALTRARWNIDVVRYADASCTTQVLEVSIGGAWQLGELSGDVPGATEAVFEFDRVALTPLSPQALTALTAAREEAACGSRPWRVGQRQDITARGCDALIELPRREYDLVRLDGERLLLGGRPPAGADLGAPDRRPLSLTPSPVLRIS